MKLLFGLAVAAIVGIANAALDIDICDNCTYSTFGLGYLPSPDNCHKFYQCRRFGNFVYHQRFCCPPYTKWNQDKLTCGWGSCPDPPPMDCPNNVNEEGGCYFLPHPKDPHKFINIYGGYEQYCAPGTIFMLEDCKCDYGGNRTCDMFDDPIIYFPFAYDFNDIQCNKVPGITFGDAYLDDSIGAICFDGDGDYMVFSYLNNYFEMNKPDSFTVSFWFNQTSEGFMNSLEGLFGNGDCNQDPSIAFYFGMNGIRKGGADGTYFGFLDGENVTNLWYPDNVWCQVSIRWTMQEVCYFLNGEYKVCRPAAGTGLNTQTGASFGLAYKGCTPYFFTGCLDDLMIFDRFVSDDEMLNCVFGRDRSPRRRAFPYKCPVQNFGLSTPLPPPRSFTGFV